MIWAVSAENTTAFNTSTSHRVPKSNHKKTLIMSCITLNWETIVILIGHVLSQQTLTDLQGALETACSNMPSKSLREVSSITIIYLEDVPHTPGRARHPIWIIYLLTKKHLNLAVCSYHVTYVFQSESTFYSCLEL